MEMDDEVLGAMSIPLSGEKLVEVSFDMNIVAHFGQERQFRLRIMEEEFAIVDQRTSARVAVQYAAWNEPPSNSSGISDIVMLLNRSVVRSVVEDGLFTISFDNEQDIQIRPTRPYEVWSLETPSETYFCLPDGKVAVFPT